MLLFSLPPAAIKFNLWGSQQIPPPASFSGSREKERPPFGQGLELYSWMTVNATVSMLLFKATLCPIMQSPQCPSVVACWRPLLYHSAYTDKDLTINKPLESLGKPTAIIYYNWTWWRWWPKETKFQLGGIRYRFLIHNMMIIINSNALYTCKLLREQILSALITKTN